MVELKNLNTLKTQTETKFHNSFSYDDRRLPAKFKELILQFDNDKITYNEYTFEVQRSSEGIIVAPNQWLYIAAYYSSYCREMFAYKRELVNHLLTRYNTKKAFEEPIRRCQNNIEEAQSLLAKYPEGNNKDFLIKFLSDYSWWGGAKSIDRSDFCASAILSSANLVNATQGYVADICEFLAENPEAEKILLTASENSGSSSFEDSKEYLEFCQDNQNYLTAIKSKPFLLLAGISGTGKSRIVRELAFMTCPKKLQDEDGTTPGNYCMIEVKPNWHDSSELLGYYSSFNGGGYRFTKFDRFVVKAWLNPNVPFFVCLDEMNLAPVEQYFAEFLSILETRSRDNEGNVVTGALVDKQYFKDDTNMKEYFGLVKGDDWTIKVRSGLVNKGLTLPPNLIVIGTVNMDDTTYQFSRKVIDRAMTIEMNGGELSQMFGNSNSLKYRSDEDVVKIGMFKAPYINADEVLERHDGLSNSIKEKLPKKLEAINTALKDTPFQVSYRVLNELVIYLGVLMDETTAKGEAIDDDALPALIDQAIDQITLMKILPRIEGDEDMFRKNGGTNVLKTLQSLFSDDTDSYKKLDEMIDRLNRTGFTRFWP